MSTKIYDAYKYSGTLPELVNIFNEMLVSYIADGFLKKKLVSLYSPFTEIDYVYGEKTIKYLKDIDSLWALSDFVEETKIGKEFNLDLIMNTYVYFHETGTYCSFYNTPQELIDKYDVFTDFHYQDQCDMSNHGDDEEWDLMTPERQKELEDDWENRRLIWNDIYDDYWTSKKAGFSYDMDIFSDMDHKRQAYHIIKDSLNDPLRIRKIKIRRLRYQMKHKKNIDEIVKNGGSVHEISNYCIEKGIKMSELYE